MLPSNCSNTTVSAWPIVQCYKCQRGSWVRYLDQRKLCKESPQLLLASALAGLGMLKTIGILKYCTDSFVKASNYWTTSSEQYYDYRTALQRFPINIAWQNHSTQWRLDTTSVRENWSVRYKLTYTEHLKTWFKWLCMGRKICIHACTLIITEGSRSKVG